MNSDTECESKTLVKNKVISGQCRELIWKVLKFMEKEGEAGAPVIPFVKVQQRVAAATGVSLRTVSSIKRQGKKSNAQFGSPVFSTPKRNPRRSKFALDDAGRAALRKILVHCSQSDDVEPTLKSIHKQFCEETDYKGSKETLRKSILKMGFRWQKVYGGTIIVEKGTPSQLVVL